MDFNAVFNRAVESAINAKKDELIKQTLKEDHDYIMFNLKKIFDETYKHLDNYLLGIADSDDVVGALRILDKLYNRIEETVTGKKVEKPVEEDEYGFQPEKDDWDGDAAQTEFYNTPMYTDEEEKEDLIPGEYRDENGEIDWDRDEAESASYAEEDDWNEDDEVITDNDFVAIVDKEKRITIPSNILDRADFPLYTTVKILKDENTNTVFIVDKDTYDKTKTFIKYRGLDESNFRIGVGGLLGVEAGDTVLIRASNDQIITLNKITNKANNTEKTTYSMKYSLEIFVDSGKRVTIPATAVADAGFEGKTVYFLKDTENNEIYITTNPDDFVELEDLNKSRFVSYGESLRQGLSKMMGVNVGSEIGIDVLNDLIVLYYL